MSTSGVDHSELTLPARMSGRAMACAAGQLSAVGHTAQVPHGAATKKQQSGVEPAQSSPLVHARTVHDGSPH
ncbi:MAG: hypothetical protein AB7P03_11840 [Kofleriaceae bacterium]